MTTRLRLALAAALAAAAFGLAPARAESLLSVGGSGQYVIDKGAQALGASGTLYAFDVGYAKSVRALGRFSLWGEADYSVGEQNGHLYQAVTTAATLQTLTVGARLTLPIRSWLVPQVRVGGGVALGFLRVDDGTTSTSSDWAAAATGYALGGVALLVPRGVLGERVSIGVLVEGGWIESSDLSFHFQPGQSGDTVHAPLTGTDLGGLALRGPVLRMQAVVRF